MPYTRFLASPSLSAVDQWADVVHTVRRQKEEDRECGGGDLHGAKSKDASGGGAEHQCGC